jgi:hypothetical protein
LTFNRHLHIHWVHIKQLNLIPQRWFYVWTHKIKMAYWMPILPSMLDFFTSINEWNRPRRTSYLATPCFENLKCLRTLLETIEFESTFMCTITHLINGLRNITINYNSIVVQMDYVALLTPLLNTYFSTLCT